MMVVSYKTRSGKTRNNHPHPKMNILKELLNNKLTMLAMYKIIIDSAFAMNLSLEGSISSICADSEVNRTQLYERKGQLEKALAGMELASPGRPVVPVAEGQDLLDWELCEKVLRYRLDFPGAVAIHKSGRTTYSSAFIRFILDLWDEQERSLEKFSSLVEVPCPTLRVWLKKDKKQPYEEQEKRPCCVPASASEDFRQIAEDYEAWQGSIRDFFKYESGRMGIGPTPVRRVLILCGMLPLRPGKSPRYRGSTTRCQPGSILVTDGKKITVQCTDTGETRSFNWQGIVDQATACHTAVVVTETECAAGVYEAYDKSCDFLGQAPQALIHDNKPVHNDRQLREHIEKSTKMIPAAPGTPENKAVIEGEFGKFEQAVGTIFLDDSSRTALMQSVGHEVCRAYTAGLNHAGRAEFNGKSRQQVLRESCPDPEKDREFIEKLHASHTQPERIDVLPTSAISRNVLNKGFIQFGLEDPDGKTKQWLADRYTPEAIRQGLAIFGTERDKGRLQNKTAHRYLVKVIQNCQEELDLRRQEKFLREFAETEHQGWLLEFESEYKLLEKVCDESTPEKNLLFQLSEKAVFSGLPLQRTFWESKLKHLLEHCHGRISAVCRHIRRLFEATWNDRFVLINNLVAWEQQLV